MAKKRKEEKKEMKLIKLLLVVAAAAAITLALGGNGLAFHEEGVAYCAGCHTMHNSQDGQEIVPGGAGGYLLKNIDGGSTCLNCHAAYGQRTQDGSGFGGGGDFYWITKTFSYSAHGSTRYSYGDSHGHNVFARDFGLDMVDAELGNKAPGGTYDHELSCASCHDPHGNTNYLLLRGNESHDGANFPAAPIAVSTGRRTTGTSGVSDTKHPAYGSGMSAWCAGCHTTFINGLASRMHPADRQLSSGIIDTYNEYVVKSTIPTGGDINNAYLEMVPFQTGAKDTSSLDTESTMGPTGGAEVACISCHRAHATAFPDAGRWDFNTEMLWESHPATGDTGVTGNDVLNSYYGKTFPDLGPEDSQRSLCNKCHAKDGPHGSGSGAVAVSTSFRGTFSK